jgi:hypothetical protein
MISKLRTRIGRLGVIMTFLAVLFAASPMLEAAACAAEGCGPACFQETTVVSASADSDADNGAGLGGCADDACMCATGHCSHIAGIPALIEAGMAPPMIDAAPFVAAEQVISITPQGLERPPRA